VSSDLTSIQSILCKVKQGDLSLPEVGRRLELGTVNSDRAEHPGQVSALRHAGKTYKAHQRKRGSETILSLTEAMYSECAADADALGFMAKMLVQTTLPHRAQPGKQYTRSDGDVALSITDLGGAGLPYGAYPRLILVWMTTEALRTGERRLELGRSLSSFMGQLGLQRTGGHWGTIPRFRGQMERLFGAAISTRWRRDQDGQNHAGGSNLLLAEEFDLWWTPQTLPEPGLGQSSVTLSQRFFEQLVEAPVPLDLRAIKALKRSPLSLDLYAWATRRVSYLKKPLRIPWASFQLSFGAGYAETPQGKSRFRGNAIEALRRVKVVYPQLKLEILQDGILLYPSLTHVPKT
jgi:Plasmid encoded RepA protein